MKNTENKPKEETLPPSGEGSSATSCSATFELANGESVSPCRRLKGHTGYCQGFSSEYELHMRAASVLDVCCGPRGMWFNKYDSRAVFIDRRDESHRSSRDDETIVIAPDILADFTEIPFPDNSFYHVVMDPPHHTSKRMGDTDGGDVAKRYGRLLAGWQDMMRAGFEECFRVLKPNGTMIFKWCSSEIPLREVLSLTPEKPLYGHKSGKQSTTHWVAFMKPNA